MSIEYGNIHRKVLDELVKEGVLEHDGPCYQYKGLAWNVAQRDIFDTDFYQVFEYNKTFFKHAKLVGDTIDVDSDHDNGEYMIFASKRAAKDYIRKTYKRFLDKIIELKNKETKEALDVLE